MKKLIYKAGWLARNTAKDPMWACRRMLGYFKPPLFIYQMGKVGSSSIKSTLETRYHMCHFHTAREFDMYCAKFPPDKHLAPVTGQFDIITATRDPIGREISAFFQNADNTQHTYGVATRQEVLAKDMDELIAAFRRVWANSERLPDTTAWFDRCFRTTTGVDIYQHPFDPARGWNIVNEGKWRVLVMRFEDINRNYLEAINAFVTARFGPEAAYPAMLRANVSEKKWYAEIMREFKERITFTKEELDAQYDSRYCRHFYAQKEIAAMRSKWREQER